MKFIFYTHSLISDWNHGNAHFLRGVMRDLIRRGHHASALEPIGAWSREHLLADQGEAAEQQFFSTFPELISRAYGTEFDHATALEDADVVVVHEWTDPSLVAKLGAMRKAGAAVTLVFHDTHHRAVSARDDIESLDLSGYDIVLAFGEVLRQRYLEAGWGRQVFTWHEAADDSIFKPYPGVVPGADLIWIGNWGDDERTREIDEFLIEPAAALGLSGAVRGVRYPDNALAAISKAGLNFGGWIANASVPLEFAQHRVTIHIPRRPYVKALPGIPTIRVFEALSCGIPLIAAPWEDAENLFHPGADFLIARDGEEMKSQLMAVLNDKELASELSNRGREIIASRHTCRHRVDELFAILAEAGTSRVAELLANREAAQ
ncbi:CgeB family protein [Pelagibacterium luteolum]|uniref:Spore maturation protein CgeB n=1 Tax=Pelagibacterium luteolum TaxID=440168 RepID=A0A1G8A709_9HYPH|nr:glycosyltransferase [Pelagibacterium luteolum]SDH16170.1 Spore maturation protein CgeB [Pelagibacterium luteolum]